MKKYYILVTLLFFMNLSFLHSDEDISIQKSELKTEVKGGNYFPLFVGQKWIWEVSINEVKDRVKWEIISFNLISDKKISLDKIYGYEVASEESTDHWYLIEYNGYICTYNPNEDIDSRITKLLPLNPKIGDMWTTLNDNYNITEMDKDKVKIQYENEEEGRFGYQIFKSGVGLYEMFEASKKNDNNSILKYNLLEYTDISKINSTDSESKKIDDSKNVKNKTTYKNIEDIKIIKLLPEKLYVQVSSFNSSKNAQNYANNLLLSGYNPKIFQDKDGYFKILLDTTSDEKEFINKIRKDIEKDAFIKQRPVPKVK